MPGRAIPRSRLSSDTSRYFRSHLSPKPQHQQRAKAAQAAAIALPWRCCPRQAAGHSLAGGVSVSASARSEEAIKAGSRLLARPSRPRDRDGLNG